MSGSESSRAAGQGRDVRALRAVTAQRPGARACLLSHKPALKSASWTEGKGGAPASRGPASRACKSGLLPAARSPSQTPPQRPSTLRSVPGASRSHVALHQARGLSRRPCPLCGFASGLAREHAGDAPPGLCCGRVGCGAAPPAPQPLPKNRPGERPPETPASYPLSQLRLGCQLMLNPPVMQSREGKMRTRGPKPKPRCSRNPCAAREAERTSWPALRTRKGGHGPLGRAQLVT